MQMETKKDDETNKLGFKINPAFFVNLKSIDKKLQKEVLEKRKKNK